MIYVERERKDKNGKLIKPSKAWFKKAKEKTEIAKKEKSDHVWDARVYGDRKEVRLALEELFHHKCAYCERSLPGEWDVEHFRPKGRVAKQNDHPGYYWLGYEWKNLYPSCKLCNQRRKDPPVWGDLRELPAKGKGDQFPLWEESTRAMSHEEDIHQEHTLLIDPCHDDPELYFGYDTEGNIFALDREENPYAEESIRVFHLDLRRLCRERRKIFRRTATVLKIIEGLQRDGADNKDALKMSKELLLEMISNGGEHAGVARFVKKSKKVFCK